MEPPDAVGISHRGWSAHERLQSFPQFPPQVLSALPLAVRQPPDAELPPPQLGLELQELVQAGGPHGGGGMGAAAGVKIRG